VLSTPTLSFRALTKTYQSAVPDQPRGWRRLLPAVGGGARRPITPVDHLTLDLPVGSLTVLVGPSGCGKSTLLRLVAGLDEATSGEIWLGGERLDGLSPRDRDVAMVFQNYALYPHMTVAANLAFPLEVRHVPEAQRCARVAEVAEVLGLAPLMGKYPAQLSGGQRQRVALGRAMVREPRVFLLDEPLSNLDAGLREQMRHEIRELQRRLGVTMLYVTHDAVEAFNLADQLVVLNQGRVQQCADPQTIYHQPANRFVAEFFGKMNFLPVTQGVLWAGLPQATELSRAWGLPDSLLLGVRPEGFRLSDEHQPGAVPLRLASVEFHPGGWMLLKGHGPTAGDGLPLSEFVVQLSQQGSMQPGSTIWVAPQLAEAPLLFDPDTGSRVAASQARVD
jgi:ABC-type sugar transport system ATPase subunit